jgi:hypothetical protein
MKSLHLISLLFFMARIAPAAPAPELTALRQQFEKTYAEQVTAPFVAAKANLDSKFNIALDNGIATAQKAGKLDDVLAIQEDKKFFAEKFTIPDDDEKTPDFLKKLRSIYREQLKNLEGSRTTALVAVLPAYQAKLQELETALTKAGRFDDAKEARSYRERLTSEPSTVPNAKVIPAVSAIVPAAEATRGGMLKGLGQFMFGNLPIDLSNASGVTDFVEVRVSHMGWIARRANGEVRFQIQAYGDKTNGIINNKKAVKVCATEGKPFFAIYEDGTAEMVGTKFDKDTNPFPGGVADVVDVDSASGLHLVLHRDGTCSVHGNHQQKFSNGLKLKEPGVISDVTAISCSRYQAYFLMKDGSVMATTSFQEKAPVWADLPREISRDIRDIAVGTSGTHLAAATQRGVAIQANGEKIPISVKDISTVKVGGSATIVRDEFRKWHIAKEGDPEMAKLLAAALTSPQIIDIDLHNFDNSGDGKLVSRAVLWIEPNP